jgi:hypothetical protein
MNNIRRFAPILAVCLCFAGMAQAPTKHARLPVNADTLTNLSTTGTVIRGDSTWGTTITLPSGTAATTTLGATGITWTSGAQTWTCTGDGSNCVVSTLSPTLRKRSAHPLTALQVDASRRYIQDAQLAPAAYLKLAKEIEMESPSTDEARMLDALHGLGYRPYDFEKVDSYLSDKALSQGDYVRWVWKPLRKKDMVAGQGAWYNAGAGAGTIKNDIYPHEVPAKVLAEAKTILDRIPDAVFLISDYETFKPDPFLAVTTKALLGTGKVWVIDRWDEPGFRPEVELTGLVAQK